MEKDWYKNWFDEEYQTLYRNRDETQAATQTRMLAQACGAQSAWRILDVGCGGGRHLRGFQGLGFHACGVDLSRVLLRVASATAAVAQADMRRLPFADAGFDLLTSFFTSFGYFVTFDEDVAALREFCRVVRPGGFLFLDLLNPEYVKNHLVAKDQKFVAGKRVEQERFLEGDCVVKRIRIFDPAGGEHHHEERVRLFSRARLEPVLRDLPLSLERLFGDETGQDFSSETSPRMSLLLRRPA